MADRLVLDAFLDAALCQRIRDEMRTAAGNAAPVYGGAANGAVDERVRRARIVAVSSELREVVKARLIAAQEAIAAYFSVALATFEDPQFLHYVEGDFFVAHQDGNTGMTRDESEGRRVSVVIFVNDASGSAREGSYGGGALVLHGRYPRLEQRDPVPAAAGVLVAFRSETTHEVLPVTRGDRFTIVTWYRAGAPARRDERTADR